MKHEDGRKELGKMLKEDWIGMAGMYFIFIAVLTIAIFGFIIAYREEHQKG